MVGVIKGEISSPLNQRLLTFCNWNSWPSLLYIQVLWEQMGLYWLYEVSWASICVWAYEPFLATTVSPPLSELKPSSQESSLFQSISWVGRQTDLSSIARGSIDHLLSLYWIRAHALWFDMKQACKLVYILDRYDNFLWKSSTSIMGSVRPFHSNFAYMRCGVNLCRMLVVERIFVERSL